MSIEEVARESLGQQEKLLQEAISQLQVHPDWEKGGEDIVRMVSTFYSWRRNCAKFIKQLSGEEVT